MLELGSKSRRYHEELSRVINSSDIDKVFIKGKKQFSPINILKKKRGNILQNNEDIDLSLKNLISNNDYLMIKGSNATGLNDFSKKDNKRNIMLFELLTSLIDKYSFLNVFKYLTFRTGLSVVTSLMVVFLIGGPLIKLFSKKMITGPIRQDGPIDHIIKKTGTPTMGGVIIIIGILSSTLLWADLKNIYVWTLIFLFHYLWEL